MSQITESEKSVKFQLNAVEEKPKRAYRKGSKYDGILDAFLKGKNEMVTVSVADKDANYLRTQLKKRIDSRKLETIAVSVINEKVYLEIIKPTETVQLTA